MNLWVVWKDINIINNNKDVLGIFKSKQVAIDVCNKMKIKFKKIPSYSITSNVNLEASDENEYHCTKLTGCKTELYFIITCELQYHGQKWFSVCKDKESAVKEALDFFDREHNDPCDACQECENFIPNDCKNNLIKNLKNNKAEIYCGDSFISFEIFNVIYTYNL